MRDRVNRWERPRVPKNTPTSFTTQRFQRDLTHKIRRVKRDRTGDDLELGGLHGDGYADEEDAGHGDGGIAAPVLGTAVWAARHAPNLGPKVPVGRFPMSMICSTPHGLVRLFLLSLTRSSLIATKNPKSADHIN